MFQRMVACLLVFVQAYLIHNYSQQPAVVLLACFLAIGSLIPLFRVSLSRRGWNIAEFCLVLLMVGRGFMFPAKNEYHWYLPCEVMVPLAEGFLLLQVMELFRKRPNDALPVHFSLLTLLTVMFIYCRRTNLDDGKTMFWGAVLITTLVGLLLQASRNQTTYRPNSLQLQNQSHKRNVTGAMPTLGRWLLLFYSFAGVTFGTWYFSGVLSRNVEYLQFWLMTSNVSAAEDDLNSARYIDRATLNSISKSQQANPNGIALNVYCNSQPGYLRGRVFDTYESNAWFHSKERGRDAVNPAKLFALDETALPNGLEITRSYQKAFAVTHQQSAPWKSITIESDPRRGPVYFTPLDVDYIQGTKTNDVQIDSHQVLINGILRSSNYTCFLNRELNPESIPPTERPALLQIPRDVDRQALQMADQIFAHDRTDRERMASVENFFSSNYRYSLKGIQFPRSADHLSYFILERPPAHCEFFASAAVIMLRTQGIPARYATGYVVTERNSDDDGWIATNRNAHAWAEAFDRQQQRWVVVEATAGIAANKSIWDSNYNDDSKDNDARNSAKKNAAGANGNSLFDFKWLEDFLEATGNVIQITISVVLITLLALFLMWRRYLTWKRNRRGGFDPRFERHAMKLRRWEKRLRRLGLVREETETLHQFVNRMQLSEESWVQEAAVSFLDYAQLRYS
jgi:transglutaminase-like putative cysteine protease